MTHQQAENELKRGTPAELICATCPWDRLCVEPPAMSQAEIERKIDEAQRQDEVRQAGQPPSMPVGMLMTALVYAGKATTGKLCPVFALRLSGPDGRQVADTIRERMKSWVES